MIEGLLLIVVIAFMRRDWLYLRQPSYEVVVWQNENNGLWSAFNTGTFVDPSHCAAYSAMRSAGLRLTPRKIDEWIITQEKNR